MFSVYKQNKTVRILGKQNALDFLKNNEVKDVFVAYTDIRYKRNTIYRYFRDTAIDILIDIYNLGVIHGIRKERSKKHGFCGKDQ